MKNLMLQCANTFVAHCVSPSRSRENCAIYETHREEIIEICISLCARLD